MPQNPNPLSVCGICAAIVCALSVIVIVARNPSLSAAPIYAPVSFKTLAGFAYDPKLSVPAKQPESSLLGRFMSSKPAPGAQFPSAVASLDRKAVSIQGFMVPLEIKDRTTSKFLLCKDVMTCCYGRTPYMNEWIAVNMKGGVRIKVASDTLITVQGVLEVGETYQSGEVLSIYRIEASDVTGPLDL